LRRARDLYGIEQVVAKDDEPFICPPLKNLRGDSARMAYSVGAGLVASMSLHTSVSSSSHFVPESAAARTVNAFQTYSEREH
jgi:hypothetical protein